ncbi:induced myeloid leukemia cell differentiation protein Mcl-1 [Indicator indicator]|uniref:induced myeloid leukemia cell differentiation protein Mcl-1 n=1 Tax=Indicator indicator TaxID=1002788 RepID=UPI0023DEF88F|nr:induced myeloid leukemia cell differentiation protein Mcl-1 [Indicator indicator]
MFAVKRNAVISFNLYCGGGPALPPASPGADPAPPPPPPASAAEVPRALDGEGGRRWATAGPPEAPRALIGCGAAPPAARWSPEQELDGCEPDCDRGPGGGSLPSTPPGPPDELWQDSLELISRYLREVAGEAEPSVKKLFPGLLGGPGRPGGSGDAVMEKALETLRRVGNGILKKHELAFQGMLRKLEIQKEEDLQSLCEVAAHMFSDGVTNWGRVVTLISFGAFVAKHLKSIKQEQCISSLATIITHVLVSSKREWLTSQGGWEGFVDFFRVEDMEGSIRKMLMALAGVAGVGASLAYMIR